MANSKENDKAEEPWIKNANSTLVLYSIMAATCVVFLVLIMPSSIGPYPSYWWLPLLLVGSAFFLYIFSAEAISEALDENNVFKYISTHFLYNIGSISLLTGIMLTVYFHCREYLHQNLLDYIWESRKLHLLFVIVFLNMHWVHDIYWLLRKSDKDFGKYVDHLRGKSNMVFKENWWNWSNFFKSLRNITSENDSE